jgi:tRNA uridine 5-carboxymethylaminomethyl modification enzyme
VKQNNIDVVVVGGGHAGVEAANILSKLGLVVGLVSMDKKGLGRMSCNPAIGGVAKGQLVREVDLLGGLMAKIADLSGLQPKMQVYFSHQLSFGHAANCWVTRHSS